MLKCMLLYVYMTMYLAYTTYFLMFYEAPTTFSFVFGVMVSKTMLPRNWFYMVGGVNT